MSEDARFEDAGGRPLRLIAYDAEDLGVVSAAVQDAVFPITEMRWQRSQRRFAVLLNRFRWEDRDAAERRGRPVERVQSVMMAEDVLRVSTQGIDQTDRQTILSLLSLTWEPWQDGAGRVLLTLAGDGAIALEVEALEITLHDVTRPYAAVSGHAPDHEP
jgi:hypothetical protein